MTHPLQGQTITPLHRAPYGHIRSRSHTRNPVPPFPQSDELTRAGDFRPAQTAPAGCSSPTDGCTCAASSSPQRLGRSPCNSPCREAENRASERRSGPISPEASGKCSPEAGRLREDGAWRLDFLPAHKPGPSRYPCSPLQIAARGLLDPRAVS